MGKLPALDLEHLAQFTGSQEFYRHPIVRDIIYTQGAKYVADAAHAYWLLEEIVLAQRYISSVSAEGFQVWDLAIKANGSAELTCGNGNGRTVFAKRIDHTDFPAPGIRFYYCNQCIHLPSEY
jgi:hypothetical protein